MTSIAVIMPALNEQANIAQAVRGVCAAFDQLELAGELIVVDDGSSDATGAIVSELSRADSRVRMIRHDRPCGIGASFWHGAGQARAQAVCLMPGDNEIDPFEVLRYSRLAEEVDMVIPFFYNSRIRPLTRRILSDLFRTIINLSFGTSFHYTNGAVIYRRKVLLSLAEKEGGFFYQTDILVRLVRRGYLFAEVPAKLQLRSGGDSKAISLRSLRAVIRGYLRLMRDVYFRRAASIPVPDSMACRRVNRHD